MKNTGIRVALLFLLQALWAGTSYSEDSSVPKFNEEISKQESIYRSEGDAVPQGYTIDRALGVYEQALASGFRATLASLGPNDRWLDIGAGEGRAILDYYSGGPDKKAQTVAISIEDRRTPAWRQTAASLGQNQLRYLINKRLREYSLEDVGKFQIITDVIGGFSYSEHLSLFMEKVLNFLDVNGTFYTVLQDVQSEQGSKRPFYKDAPFLTEIADASGAEVKVCSWLKSITCVEVSCESKTGWKPPIEAFRVQKVCSDVKVPALIPTHFQAGTPPERRYQVSN